MFFLYLHYDLLHYGLVCTQLTKLPLFHMMQQTCGVLFRAEALRKLNSNPLAFGKRCVYVCDFCAVCNCLNA